jgi:NosR/NirI family nitrous oxide reductase transcriptional regulator
MLTVTGASGQNTADADVAGQLKKLFPNATSFSAKTGTPAVYRALGPGGEKDVIGFAYWTTELEPLERGFDGPIKMLVGMDMKGLLTGVIVTDHREPYGYFSVDLPEWPAQFVAKNIRDPFKVDAIARATISVTSASRAVRNASRKVARAYLAPPPAAPATAQTAQ